jgi:hypothetical protein
MMNRFFKVLGVSVVVLIAFVIIGAQVVQALREAAAPPALPYGLTMEDTRAIVEQKLGQPRVSHALQAGWEPGLPDEGGSPDRLHYWAIYRRFGIVIIYNSPSPKDRGATIHAVFPTSGPDYLMNQDARTGLQ